MAFDRYEDYARFSDGVPFVFHDRLERNEASIYREANWHENCELQFCDEGEGRVLLDGVHIPFRKGDAVAVNGGMIHRTETERTLVYSCLIFDSAFCQRAGIDIGNISFEPHFKSEKVAELFGRIRIAYEDRQAPCRTARLQLLSLELLIELCEHHTAKCVSFRSTAHGVVKHAISYIRTHFREKISLADVARGIYVNKYVLSRRFKEVTGQTVVEYLNSYRCMHAAELLEKGAGVGEAARSSGFSNLSFFAKCFQKYMGSLPKNWRK